MKRAKNTPTSIDELGMIRIADKSNEHSFKCNCLAVYRHSYKDSELILVGFAGAASSVKAGIAIIQGKSPAKVTTAQIPGFSEYLEARRVKDRTFKVDKVKLGKYGIWHALAMSERPDLMLDSSDASLWAVLSSERFTTPLLRHWLPWLRAKLTEARLLIPLDCWGCNASLLRATTQSLDSLVSAGVASGELTFT